LSDNRFFQRELSKTGCRLRCGHTIAAGMLNMFWKKPPVGVLSVAKAKKRSPDKGRPRLACLLLHKKPPKMSACEKCGLNPGYAQGFPETTPFCIFLQEMNRF